MSGQYENLYLKNAMEILKLKATVFEIKNKLLGGIIGRWDTT